MSDISAEPMLGAMRVMAVRAAGGATAPVAGEGDFAATLKGLLAGVNAQQLEAGRLARAFELGDGKADLPEVMINQQKSRLMFQATLQVRNKLVAAYQDIMNMPV